ncbi:vWA domain-containing protein [Amycolatopsis sacchari]|uniref:von Willebrand factor type A domain-containing protein n=1 Tax=Amycolatopsis sacchari TaxID=115433 RepID=A0A1I3M0W7_9PSEU|nr:vWA domain-containing protein [Amycolatopsis sacchari]SFI90577.1 von Willebrand factor type A domain-containing protein [Amycolatopsis sacchari]
MSAQGNNLQYAVDIVLCVDATLSMRPILDDVKHSALSFPGRLAQEMKDKGRGISSLRLKVIAFRDFGDRADDAISESPFFSVPHELDDFERTVRELTPSGGGDEPESGLEALALAMASKWETGLDRRRHVIVVFTDAPAHPLGDRRQRAAHTYPASIPSSLDGLFEQWGHRQSPHALMENSAKRLLVFAPEEYPWTDIADDWNHTLFFPSTAGEGLEEWEMDEIIATIANSL